MLFLMVLGAASVNAQVRIGGNGVPNAAAVLDLNATDDATPAANKGALALPRVSLASVTAQLNGATPITGMLVYNTNATLGVGIYFWNGTNWIIISGDGIIGNELTDTIANGGLNKTGVGTAASPYKVGIKTGGITTDMIANGAITGIKIATVPADSGLFLMSNGSSWLPSERYGAYVFNQDSIKTVRPLRSVTWYNVVDTTMSITFITNRITTVYVAGIAQGDVCFPFLSYYASKIWTDGSRLYVVSLTNSRGTVSYRFRCFRASF